MEKIVDICNRNNKYMANNIINDQKGVLEFSNIMVDYSDGDIDIFDHVTDIHKVFPLNPMKNLIALCNSGSLTIKIGETEVFIQANDVLFCPPNIYAEQFNCSPDFECKVLFLSDHIIQGLLQEKISLWNRAVYVNHLNVIAMSEVCREEFGLYYKLLKSKIQNSNNNSIEIIQSIVKALLLELCVILEKSPGGVGDETRQSQGKTLFNRFLRLVANNEVKRQPITIYASTLAITPKYLTMLCLKYSNKTASDWIVQYTIEDIRFYLKNSNLSIKEISAKLGFANMSHFGSYVRKHLGESPSSFRHKK